LKNQKILDERLVGASGRPLNLCMAAFLLFLLSGCATYRIDTDAAYTNLTPDHVIGTMSGESRDGLFGTDTKWAHSFLIETQVDPKTGETIAKQVTPLPVVSSNAPTPVQSLFNTAASSSANAALFGWVTEWLPKPQTNLNVNTGKK
jgi:hypothetical protein